MKKLEIIEINDYEYHLKDDNNKIYIINIEFQDIDIKPNINDYIYISEKLLDKNYKEYSKSYTFGNIDSIYGRKIEEDNDVDIIAISINNKKTYMKRLYG